MKVLKQGVIPEPVLYAGRCRRCQCEFLVDENELLTDAHVGGEWLRPHPQGPYYTCPTCQRPVFNLLFVVKESGSS